MNERVHTELKSKEKCYKRNTMQIVLFIMTIVIVIMESTERGRGEYPFPFHYNEELLYPL